MQQLERETAALLAGRKSWIGFSLIFLFGCCPGKPSVCRSAPPSRFARVCPLSQEVIIFTFVCVDHIFLPPPGLAKHTNKTHPPSPPHLPPLLRPWKRVPSHRVPIYQLAFCTPGKLPAMACNRKLYCTHPQIKDCQPISPRFLFFPSQYTSRGGGDAYPRQLEIPEDTSSLAAQDAPVPDLRRVRVAVHLRQLELGRGAHARRERRVADDVAEGLSVMMVDILVSCLLDPPTTTHAIDHIPPFP